MCYAAEFASYNVKQYEGRYREAPFKITKVVGTDTDDRLATTYDFLLAIHSNQGPISCCFRDKRRFLSRIASFVPTPCIKRRR